MLAKVAPPSNDFHALARYLVHGKAGTSPHPNRVAWTCAHNVPSDEPDTAATYMTATAALSPRTKNAVYHLMIAWHEAEQPTSDIMQSIALETLTRAGLAEHQALIMGHGDTPHRHLHMMINRVHPTTGKAWKTSHDFARFDRIMRELAGAHGFIYVPAHQLDPEHAEHCRKGPTSRAWRAARYGAPTARPQWSRAEARRVGERLSERIDRTSSFDDVVFALAEEGLNLEEKGRGLVVGTSRSYGKFSSLGLTLTAKDLRKRSRTRPANPWALTATRSVFSVDGVDIVRALATLGLTDRNDLQRAIDEAVQQRQQRTRSPRHNRSSTSLSTLVTLRPTHRPARNSPHPRSAHEQPR